MIAPTATKTKAKNRRPNATSGAMRDAVPVERATGRSTRTSYSTNRTMPNPTRPIPLPGLRCRWTIVAAAMDAPRATAEADVPTMEALSGLGRSAGAYLRHASHHQRWYCGIHRRAAPQFGHANFDRAFGAYARHA